MLTRAPGIRTTNLQRGASRAATPEPLWPKVKRVLSPILIILFIAVAARLGVDAFTTVAATPIRQVSVEGDFVHLSEQNIQAAVLPHVGEGFFHVDLETIQAELENMPWVYEAQVWRRWPDRLNILITEQVPTVRWGEEALLNPLAQVFSPEALDDFAALPVLSGPPNSENQLLASYDTLMERLGPLGLRIQSLKLDGKQALSMTLDNGLRIVIGRNQVRERLSRLMDLLSGRFGRVNENLSQIDLRYANGVAIRTRKPLEVAGK